MAGLLIFADICTPPARLRKPLSKDGFSTLENRPKPLAGHLYGLAKIVTGGRNPKSKPSLPHARTALSRQKATRALHKRLAPRRCVERRAAQKETRCHCYFHLRSRHHNRHLLQQVRQLSLLQPAGPPPPPPPATGAVAGGRRRCFCCRIGGHLCHRGSNSASAATAAGCEARLRERQVSDGRLQPAGASTCAHALALARTRT